jgi:ATP-dependent Clp protease ATP-binding subunit ClpA
MLQLDDLVVRLKWLGISCNYDTKSVQNILKSTYNPEYGARPVRRYIQDRIEDVVADMILSPGKQKTQVTISAKWDDLIFDWK